MRFSPEFAAKLRKKVGPDKHAFIRARRAFLNWRMSECIPLVISPFIAHYVNPARPDAPDSGRDITTEWYDSPFTHFTYPVTPEPESEPLVIETVDVGGWRPGLIIPILHHRRAREVS